jgi:hypothetical protein
MNCEGENILSERMHIVPAHCSFVPTPLSNKHREANISDCPITSPMLPNDTYLHLTTIPMYRVSFSPQMFGFVVVRDRPRGPRASATLQQGLIQR